MPAPARARVELLITDAGARATPDAPLARLRLEPDDSATPGAVLSLTL